LSEIVGISSGRNNKVVESVVREVLAGTGKSFEFVSLAGKLIRPCEGCNGCADTNRCILKDDFQQVADLLLQADGIVFGAPTYWGHMNSKALAFWERICFAGRHNSLFPLSGKPAVVVATDGTGNGEFVFKDMKVYFTDARINLVGELAAQGEYPCFTCGYGNYCPVGGLIEYFPLGTEITSERVPSITNQHPEKCELEPSARDLTAKARQLGTVLGKVVNLHHSKSKKEPN
jgi:multimeric flavodoxin WrbA